MNPKRFLLVLALFALSLTLSFISGYIVHDQWGPSNSDLPIMQQAKGILERHALADLPEDPALEYGMIHGMLDAYGDPYTRFTEPVQAELNSDNLTGSYGGIGATLSRDEDGNILLYPFPESPAAEAGILDADRLILVDEMAISPETPMDEVVAALRGPEGDPVSLTISRPPSFEEHSFRIKREDIPLPSVTWRTAPIDETLGIIKVNVIAASTAEEIEIAVADLQSQGAVNFALDLRGNGGGLVDAGVNVASLFLDDGEILQEQYSDKPIETYEVEEPGPFVDLPLVVLVDGNTASAAEIVTGALQTRGRAPIIGSATFGKDTIQLGFELQDGSSIHVTAAKWWIPGLDVAINETGLTPDIQVEPSTENLDTAIQAAIQYFNQGQ
ncbi:MAG: S41 family peptidase [Anaerolineales bacterium]|nr:S41 family peptidase [Anaerolineales bacterium]